MESVAEMKLTTHHNLEVCFPTVAIEWHPVLNKGVLPSEVSPHSGKKFWFLCGTCDEAFEAEIGKRTRKNNPTGCPYCAGKKVGLNNCIANTHPHLLEEWDFKKNLIINLIPYNVTGGSNIKAHWICSHCNKPFQAMIAKRALRNQGCKKCSRGTSFPEQFICYCLEKFFGEDNVFNRIDLDGKEIDQYVRNWRLAIEYCGRFYHKNLEKDKKKVNYLLSLDPPLKIISIRETGCPELSIDGIPVIESKYTNTNKEALREVLVKLVNEIKKIIRPLDKKHSEVFERKAQEFLQALNIREISPIIYARIRTSRKKSFIPFISKRPDLLLFWNEEKNKIKPHSLSKASTNVVFWKCPKGHEWQESIYCQVQRKTICSKCEHPSLNETHPKIVLELIDRSLGDKLSFGSERNVDWICSTCNLPYSMKVYQKVKGKMCPHCFKNTYSLAATHPHLIIEWHKTQNEFTPEEVSSGSGRLVTWKCDLGHQWTARINKRTRKNPTNCPKCHIDRMTKLHS